MPDDEDDEASGGSPEAPPSSPPATRTSSPPAARRGPRIIKLRVPLWFLCTLLFGWLLTIRLEMTTDYVGRGRLEIMAMLLSAVVASTFGVRFARKRSEDDAKPTTRLAVFRFMFVLLVTQPLLDGPAFAAVALVNRLGKTEDQDVVRVRCTATRLEVRTRFRLQGSADVVDYLCTMPDGQRLHGHAAEELPIEPGKPIIIAATRGRLGTWMRMDPPEPVSDDPPAPAPAPAP
jgi:hypothetical protein